MDYRGREQDDGARRRTASEKQAPATARVDHNSEKRRGRRPQKRRDRIREKEEMGKKTQKTELYS